MRPGPATIVPKVLRALRSPSAQPRRQPGFSLVLSLVVMAAMVMLILSIAGFLTVESRLVGQQQLRLRARLNAAVALRLAVAHLQQEAGPDRRITGRADLMANTTQAGWTWQTIKNPLWTGVWRSDKQLQPPAWLVSGRHDQTPGCQSANLFGETEFYVDQWVPWQTDYTIPAAQLIPLVGNASASPYELVSVTSLGKPDGRISLPRVPLPDGGNGAYCYWIGDEGVKARINLTDPRLTPPTGSTSPQLKQEALRGAARSGDEILPGLSTLPPKGMDSRITQMRELPFLTNPGLGLTETTPATVARHLYTEATLWSRGVNCDSVFGGLKTDLSLAFEKTDAEWKASEFGEGLPPKDSAGAQLSGSTYVFNPNGNGVRTAYDNIKLNVRYDGISHSISPIYSFYTYRGPMWEALRNYHRLYKELDWSSTTSPAIIARTLFPNSRSLYASGYGANSHYGRFYNRTDSPTGDFMNTDVLKALQVPRPTKVAVSPYICRQLVVWGLQNGGGTLRLTASPITVLHNPYNVALRLSRDSSSTENSALRLSFRKWDNLTLKFQTTSKGPWTHTVGEMARAHDPSCNAYESLRTYIANGTLLQPGEFRVFSTTSVGPAPLKDGPAVFNRLSGNMIDGIDYRGGFWMNCQDNNGLPLALGTGEDLTISMQNTGVFEARLAMSAWPGDRLTGTSNSDESTLSNTCSELNTLTVTDLRQSGTPAAKVINGTISGLPGPTDAPLPFAAHDYNMRWPKDALPFPLFSHSNPMAPVTRADANGMATISTLTGFAFTSPSYRMQARTVSSWAEVIETAGASGSLAYGGLSCTSGGGGVNSAVYSEVPFAPPLSLAQYTHANLGLRDQDPLFLIGNSFAPLNTGIASAYGGEAGVLNPDLSWMLNSALYDRFFLSGAAPVIARGTIVTETKSLNQVLDDFANGIGSLSNPRIKLYSTRDPGAIRAMVGDHRRIAGAILTDGTFNVNSTSVEAWAALLAGAKRNAMGMLTELQPTSIANARFPRAVRADATDGNYKTAFNTPTAWTGLATLDDAQIKLLAKSIVDEIRSRLLYNHRYQYGISPKIPDVHYKIIDRGVFVPLPFIGLSQFVNRFLCGTYMDQVAYQGCLQNAILRADYNGANLSDRSTGPAPTFAAANLYANTADGSVPRYPYPENVLATYPPTRINKGHALRAAPTSLLQSDILEAVGTALSTRSDTFVIRCYGDAASALDSNSPVSTCWIEAVVQRIPEFCDASQPPETEVCSPTECQDHNPLLSSVNRTLGRRFKIMSVRELSLKDL